MRPSDVANYLGLSRQRVDQLETLGRAPTPHLVGIHRMRDSAEVEAWADQEWWGSGPLARESPRVLG